MDKKDIESIVPLLPMQQNFLWHSLKEDSRSNVIQLRCTLSGTIDTDLLIASWDATVQKFQALRSTVHWKNVKTPVQVVHKSIDSTLEIIDVNTKEALCAYQFQDSSTQIELTKTPSFRMAVQFTAKNTCEVVWSMSHVLVDGWSSTVVLNTWINIYSDMLAGISPSSSDTLQLSDYTKWIIQQDHNVLTQFWNEHLPDAFNSHDLPYKEAQSTSNNSVGRKSIASHSIILPKDKLSALKKCLKSAGLSLGTVLQLGFATVMHSKSSTIPIVFATTVSGRQMDIPHIEDHVGMFINMLPASVRFDLDASILNWARQFQSDFFNSLPFAHISPLQTASLRAEKDSLYDCLLVIENQPTVLSTPALKITNLQSAIISEFDLTLIAIPGDTLNLAIHYDESVFRKHNMELLLNRLLDLLTNFSALLTQPVKDLDRFKVSSHIKLNKLDDNRFNNSEREFADKLSTCASSTTSMLEQSIQAIWLDTLKIDKVSLKESFFDLGGTSIQAVVIFNRINERLDTQLPATALFKAPTIKDLAALIQHEHPESLWSSITGINISGSKSPLFIPFEHVDMLMYHPLITELGSEQPIYGLQISQSDYPSNELLENLTAHIIEIQPAGPYRLAGLSGAGFIALDLAQRLNSSSEGQNLVVLLDSYGPEYPQLQSPYRRLAAIALRLARVTVGKIFYRLDSYFKRLLNHNVKLGSNEDYSPKHTKFTEEFKQRLDDVFKLTVSIVNEMAHEVTFAENWVNRIILYFCELKPFKSSLRAELVTYNQGLLIQQCKTQLPSNNSNVKGLRAGILGLDPQETQFEKPAFTQLLSSYQSMYGGLSPYKGNVLYCKAEVRPAGIVDDYLVGWKELLPSDTTIVTIPGNHKSILKKPNVQIVADAISREIDRISYEP